MLQFHFYGAHWKDNFEPNKSYLLKVNNISEFMNEWQEYSFMKNEFLKFKFKIKQSVRKELIQHTPVVCFHTSITVFASQLANRDTEFMRHPVDTALTAAARAALLKLIQCNNKYNQRSFF